MYVAYPEILLLQQIEVTGQHQWVESVIILMVNHIGKSVARNKGQG